MIMGLMERVATLIRANLNDLVDKAEHPEKIIKQLILDMENQFIQVKTQVAVAIVDQHILEQKAKENSRLSSEWMQKAELAVQKEKDDLARAALERYQNYYRLAQSFKEQVADQVEQVESLKEALHKLEHKLAEARAKSQILIAQHRRSRSVSKARDAQISLSEGHSSLAFERAKDKVVQQSAVADAKTQIVTETLEDRFAALQRNEEIEALLTQIKSRRAS
jgi:phage shock protein A